MSAVNKTGLMAIIQPLTGLLATSVSWDHDPEGMVSDVDTIQVTLLLRTFVQYGTDDRRFTFTNITDPAHSTYQNDVVGQRSTTLVVRAESYNRSSEAGELLELLRTRLQRNSVLYALNAINLAYQTSRLITDLPTIYDNRVVSVAVLEIDLSAISVDLGTIQNGGFETGQGWIDTVDGNNIIPGTITNG